MIVVGAGRVGTALRDASVAKGIDVDLVDRERGWEVLEGPSGRPVVVAVRNDDLDAVLARVPPGRRNDLVFVQNGAVRFYLHDHGHVQATRGLLFFAVAQRGGPIVDGGGTVFCGTHQEVMGAWLHEIGIRAQSVDWAVFGARECEKLLWLTTFGILCELTQKTVGEVADEYGLILEELVRELQPVLRATYGLEFPTEWMVPRLQAYSRTIPTWRATVKEWRWRDGWFVEQAAKFEIPTPLHHELLKNVGKWPAETPAGA